MKTDSRIIKPINHIAKELHRYKPQVIPNKKKTIPRKSKHKDYRFSGMVLSTTEKT